MAKEPEEDEDDMLFNSISSANECTGMIPTPPLTEEQEEAYSDIYSVPQKCASSASNAENAQQQKQRSTKKA